VEQLDRQIVRLLTEDGRRSYTDLAKETGLSVSRAPACASPGEAGCLRAITPRSTQTRWSHPDRVRLSDADRPGRPGRRAERLTHLSAIEACHSVAGEESYILKVRVASPAALEVLLQEIRAAANVATRTTSCYRPLRGAAAGYLTPLSPGLTRYGVSDCGDNASSGKVGGPGGLS